MIPNHEADAFVPPKINISQSSIEYRLINGLENWDGKHFLHISQHGYIYEHSAAFFPLFPFFLRLVHGLVSIFVPDVSYILCAVLVNLILFNIASIYLFKLTMILFGGNKLISMLSCLFFSINPASVFFTAAYSESLFTTLTLASLYYLFSSCYFLCFILLYLSCLTRSNGLLNCGFLLYFFLRAFVEETISAKKSVSLGQLLSYFIDKNYRKCLILLLIRSFLSIFTVFFAFFCFQYYIYLKFCTHDLNDTSINQELVEYAQQNNYVMQNSDLKPIWLI